MKKTKIFGNASGVTVIQENPSTPAKGLSARIASTFNTGWMGDIRRAYLCNTEVESVSGAELVTNGTFDVDTAGWTYNPASLSVVVTNGIVKITSLDGSAATMSISVPVAVNKPHILVLSIVTNSPQSYFVSTNGGAGNFATGYFGTGISRVVATPTLQGNGAFVGMNIRPSRGASLPAIGDYVEIDYISLKEVIPDRSYKAAGANIYGALVKSPVS